MPKLDSLCDVLLTKFNLLRDALRFIRVSLRPRCALAASNLFLRKPWLGTWSARSNLVGKGGCQVDAGVAFQTVGVARGSYHR
jgi:hypothetical protein